LLSMANILSLCYSSMYMAGRMHSRSMNTPLPSTSTSPVLLTHAALFAFLLTISTILLCSMELNAFEINALFSQLRRGQLSHVTSLYSQLKLTLSGKHQCPPVLYRQHDPLYLLRIGILLRVSPDSNTSSHPDLY